MINLLFKIKIINLKEQSSLIRNVLIDQVKNKSTLDNFTPKQNQTPKQITTYASVF